MRLFIISIYAALLLIISPPSLSAYTTMTLEGVKQIDGVWTAAGVMDTSGFVRTTGAVTVSGHTASTSVALAVERNIARNTFRNVVSKMGPVGLTAVGAFEVYNWMTSDGLVPCDENGTAWCHAPDLTGYDNSYQYGQAYKACSGTCYFGSTRTQACTKAVAANPSYKLTNITDTKCNVSFTNGSPAGYFELVAVSCTIVGNVATSCTQQKDPNKPSPTPLSPDYFQNRDPSLPVLSDGFNHIPSLRDQGVPISGTSFNPFSTWLGDPYFKDGNWYRDRADISPCPTSSQPTRVCVDIGPQKLEGQTDPNTTPTDTPATGTTPKEQTDFCKKNPQSIACQELGELEQEPFDPIEKPFQITPKEPWGSGDAQCPAPKVMQLTTGSTVTLSYQPACDFFRGVRPAVLALAMLAALYIALGIPVGKGD